MVKKSRKFNRIFNYNYDYHYFYVWYKYHTHFFHSLIFVGNKLWAFNFFNNIKLELKLREKNDPLLIFSLSISAIAPELLLFPLQFGGITNEVPMPITTRKQIIFATKWVIKLLRDKFGLVNIENIIKILLESLKDNGLSIDKRDYTHEEGIRNRYLIRYFK